MRKLTFLLLVCLTAGTLAVAQTTRRAAGTTDVYAIVAEVDRRLSIIVGVKAEVDANLKRAQALRQSCLAFLFVPT